jgi:asparagine synthase (glutamine-hydrolysing)
MATPDGRHHIVFNGEVYNYRELRRSLDLRGERFTTGSDTEVLLRLLALDGPVALAQVRGMFALAWWDTQARALILARDRFGIKPLYVAAAERSIAFASEIHALVSAGLVDRAIDPAGVLGFLAWGTVPPSLTYLSGVESLPAGTWMRWSQGGDCAHHAFADVTAIYARPHSGCTEPELRTRVGTAVQQSVAAHLVADVPVGLFLSGGIDSSAILSAAAAAGVAGLNTYTIRFDDRSSEHEYARLVASAFGATHHELVLDGSRIVGDLPDILARLDQPTLDAVNSYYVSAAVADTGIKTVLSGAGGDELFGGYPWRYDRVEGLSGAEFEATHYGYWTRLVADADKPALFTPALLEAVHEHPPLEAYRSAIAPAEGLDPMSRALYFETKTFLHGLLIVEDKVSMAHSLESRVPFLDNGLVDVARRIPSSLKQGNGTGKRLLRDAMREFLPAEIIEKPKQGFSPPDQAWYRGESMAYIKQILLDPRTLDRGYFRDEYIRRVLQEHLEGKVNHRLLIWSLLAFEWWNRLYIDGEATTAHGAWHLSRATAVVRQPSR